MTRRSYAVGLAPASALLAALAEVVRAWSKNETFTLGAVVVDGTAKPLDVELPFTCAVVPGFDVQICPDGSVRWDTVDDVFPPGMVDDMFGAFCRLLEGEQFSFAPEQLAAVNATDRPLPDVLPHELLARQAELRPDAPAVITSSRRLSFGSLYRRANQIGRTLRESGAKPGRLVGIVMEKGWEQYAAVFGVLTAGAAYLPIDPDVPDERLGYLLDNGEVELVLTQSRVDCRLHWPGSVRRFRVDNDFDGVDDASVETVQQQSDLAYVIYTSGSTGRPKGVMVDNRGVLNTILDINRRFDIGADDRSLAVSSLHFDASVFDVFGPLVAGGAVVVPSHSERPDPEDWAELVERENVTCWLSVPALMEMLVGHLERAGGSLRSLRLAMIGGDWIPLDLPDRMRALGERVQVVGIGGPTETVCVSIMYPIEDVDPSWTSIPYGKPMTNQHYYVLDEHLRPRPVWVAGQICIGSSVGLAKGYWRDPALTASRFLTMPGTGERIFASGDVGRYLPDGNIEILGREDFQVKIQGYRIELGEIESALASHPSVASAVVVAPLRRLVAFVVPRSAPLDPEELRRFLGDRLPSYMVPSQLRLVDELPLTGNGKVDRLSLIDLAAEVDSSGVQPRSPLETAVAGLCADVLGVARVGIHDNFFSLGGDSLAAARLCGRVYDLYGAELSMRRFFAGPTVAEMCQSLLTAKVIEPSNSPADNTTALPGQRGMWTAERLMGGCPYTLVFAAQMDGPLDVGLLDDAIARTVARHEGLRTGFRMGASDLERFVLPDDWRPPLMSAVVTSPFDLDGPPLRTSLVRRGPEDNELVLTTHHMLLDGWAIGLVFREIFTRYDAAVRGTTPKLPPAPRPATVLARQRQLRETGELRRQAEFWTRRLHDVSAVLDLPAARPRPARQDPAGAQIPLEYGAGLSLAVDRQARELGVTKFAVLLAGFGRLLAHYTGRRQFLVGVPTSRRPTTELHDLVAQCTVVVPVVVDVADVDETAYVQAVHRSVAESLSNADLPFEEMVRIAGGNGDMRRNPLVQVVFGMYDKLIDWRMSAGPMTVRIEERHAGGTPMDLTVALQRSDPIGGILEFATGVLQRAEAERLRDDLLTITDELSHNRVKTIRA